MGRLARPGHENIQFLPERPYLPAGTLREVLVRVASDARISDEEVHETLGLLELEVVATRAGGLHAERDWGNILALGEQQLLAIARILLARPRFAFLDHMGTALTSKQLQRVLEIFSQRSISYVAIAGKDEPLDCYDAVLVIENDGSWTHKKLGESDAGEAVRIHD
jgi:putative ATP-binding cassette transporter